MKHTGADSRLALTQRLKLRQLLLLGMLTPNVMLRRAVPRTGAE